MAKPCLYSSCRKETWPYAPSRGLCRLGDTHQKANKPEIYAKKHTDATTGAQQYAPVELSCYPFCDLSEHLTTGRLLHNNFLLDFEVLLAQTIESFVHSLAGSFTKIMVSTGEPQRLPTAVIILGHFRNKLESVRSLHMGLVDGDASETKKVVPTGNPL